MGKYIYTLDKPFIYSSQIIQGITFKNEWLEIYPEGKICIQRGYAWDGCSPKYIFKNFYFGVPDGPIMPDGYPQTAWASLVHDSLCQFKRDIPITKAQTLQLFDHMLREANWKLRPIYVAAVSMFGPQKFGGD